MFYKPSQTHKPVSRLPDEGVEGVRRQGLEACVDCDAVEGWRQVGGRHGLADSQTLWDGAKWAQRSPGVHSIVAGGAFECGFHLTAVPALQS